LAQIPGISNWLCGSAVTYRQATKSQWLSISPEDLARYTAVSEQIAQQMAVAVLRVTDEADLAASITGYLGPAAPEGLDGLIFVGLCRRQRNNESLSARVLRHQLSQPGRTPRQREAAAFVLQAVLDFV
jgi:PncC family amidohydrolase